MTAPTIGYAGAVGPYTVDDLDAMPDDGRRHELIDGTLVVSPAPGYAHQHALLRLAVILLGACTPEFAVVVAPFDVRLSGDTSVQPDVLVARRTDIDEKNLPVAPVMAVEVRSPRTALYDRTLKKATCEAWGVPQYWIVDPDPDSPALTVFFLGPSGLHDAGTTHAADEEFRTDAPFPVIFRPADLVAS